MHDCQGRLVRPGGPKFKIECLKNYDWSEDEFQRREFFAFLIQARLLFIYMLKDSGITKIRDRQTGEQFCIGVTVEEVEQASPDSAVGIFEESLLPLLSHGLFRKTLVRGTIDLPHEPFLKVFLPNNPNKQERDIDHPLLSLISFCKDNQWSTSEDPFNQNHLSPNLLVELLESFQTNKLAGSHFTPLPFATWMARQVLVGYLSSQLRMSLRSLDDLFLPANLKSSLPLLLSPSFLTSLKVVDPAVGAGSLLIAFHNVLVELVGKAHRIQEVPFDQHKLSLTIITQCLHGVDLFEGALEVTQLRLLLLLANDYRSKNLTVLSLDLHFRLGNALFGFSTTPDILGSTMLDISTQVAENYHSSGNFSVCDLIKMKRILSEQTTNIKDEKEHIAEEIDKQLREVFDKAYFLKNDGTENSKYQLDRSPAYYEWPRLFHWPVEFPEISFDIVVGNPPYANVDLYGAGSPILRLLKSDYQTIWMDKSDLSHYFVARSSELARHVTLILSNSFLYATKARKLRNFLISKGNLTHLVNFLDFPIFPNVGIRACVIFLNADLKSRQLVKTLQLSRSNYDGREVEKIVSNLGFRDTVYKPNQPFVIFDPIYKVICDRIDAEHPKLRDILTVGKGMETGANEVYLSADFSAIPDSFIRKRVTGSSVKRYTIQEDKLKPILFFGEENLDELPKEVQHHLLLNKERLEARADKRRRPTSNWWTYTFPLHRELYPDYDKIWTSYRAKQNTFALDQSRDLVGLTNTTVIFGTNPDVQLRYVLGLLNSKVLEFRYRSIGKPTGGGLREYFENQVGNLPIPMKSPEEQQTLVSLVKELEELIKTCHSIEGSKQLEEVAQLERRVELEVCRIYGLSEEDQLYLLQFLNDNPY